MDSAIDVELSWLRRGYRGLDQKMRVALSSALIDVVRKWQAEGGAKIAVPNAVSRYEKRPKFGAETSILGTKNVPPGLAEAVKKKLVRARVWRGIEDALAMAALVQMLDKHVSEAGKTEIDNAQGTLDFDGAEYLPKRFGTIPIVNASVKRLFAYKEKYEKQTVRDSRRLDVLRTLTERVKTFRYTNPDLTIGEALIRLQAPRGLALVETDAGAGK